MGGPPRGIAAHSGSDAAHAATAVTGGELEIGYVDPIGVPADDGGGDDGGGDYQGVCRPDNLPGVEGEDELVWEVDDAE
jgi:hypothetical protein